MIAADLDRFFGDLNAKFESADVSARQALERFFNDLAPRLEAARTVERALDRQLARQFNAFDYLRPDEQRLSKMIGDLLDPDGPHGQGPVFLRLLLERVGFARGADPRTSRVDRELPIENQRRLDVAVDIDGRHCLAIENKPFAGDQKNQIKDYLAWLRKNYGDRFLLIYLTPRGEAPSAYSVKLTDLQDEAGNAATTFRIMPYHRAETGAGGNDEFAPYRTGFGLADWLRECRRHCDVERLRWFLREAETWCERRFGGSAMTTGEHKVIRDFVLADDRNWGTARAVHSALPEIDAEVRRLFLESIANRLAAAGYHSGSGYGDKPLDSWVAADLPQWRQYQDAETPEWSRTHLCLEAFRACGNDWYIGIRLPVPKSKMSKNDLKRRKLLEKRLIKTISHTYPEDESWPWYEHVDERYRNWDALIPALHRELQQDGGEITNYFVNKFVEIAEFAKPILDDIEGSPG